MNHYPENEGDRQEIEKLNVEPWMVEALRRNPSEVWWGNHADYMRNKDSGWSSPVELDMWADVGEQDELTEIVHGYFFLRRAHEKCLFCDGIGLNPATKQLYDDWDDFAGAGRRWNDALTQGFTSVGRKGVFQHISRSRGMNCVQFAPGCANANSGVMRAHRISFSVNAAR